MQGINVTAAAATAKMATNPQLGVFVNQSIDLAMNFFGLINSIGEWGITFVNLILSTIGYSIPESINLVAFNLNTSAAFTVSMTLVLVVIVWNKGGELIKTYSKYLIAITASIIILSIVSASFT